MDIGPQQAPIIIEPLEDPVPGVVPPPVQEPANPSTPDAPAPSEEPVPA